MMLKVKSGQYVDTQTGATYTVQETENCGWQISFRHPNMSFIHAVENGYESKEDAQAALDEFAAEQEVGVVQPPSTEEETVVSAEVDYHAMTVDQLKTELAEQELSQSGNKEELVRRLEEHNKSD